MIGVYEGLALLLQTVPAQFWPAALLSEFPFGYLVLLHMGVGIIGVYKELHIHFSQRFRPGRHDVMKSNFGAGGGERRR